MERSIGVGVKRVESIYVKKRKIMIRKENVGKFTVEVKSVLFAEKVLTVVPSTTSFAKYACNLKKITILNVR